MDMTRSPREYHYSLLRLRNTSISVWLSLEVVFGVRLAAFRKCDFNLKALVWGCEFRVRSLEFSVFRF